MKISYKDLNRFLSGPGKVTCPYCGCEKYDILNDDRGYGYSMYPDYNWDTGMREQSGPVNVVPVVVTSCAKCFTLRTIPEVPVMEWIKNNPHREISDPKT